MLSAASFRQKQNETIFSYDASLLKTLIQDGHESIFGISKNH